ncbi:tRNA lysidine(34) synthetase TilS [Gammaproteobacteria bacterium]|nr:tRNA lysidine(34) synthetase TilS [Gammaproteobacteria bacterium]
MKNSKISEFKLDFFNKSEQLILLNAENIVVGFSGGVDSTLALAATNQFLEMHGKKNCLTALHVNHQTQSASTAWQKHCEKFCKAHNINFLCKTVKINETGQGYEAAARSARLEVFHALHKESVIILGHHLDDQVETVFFRVLRGTGLKGLTGMQRNVKINGKNFIRPLLHITKEEIHGYINNLKLSFIEDQSNTNNKYSRNFLRNQIIPQISERWPGAKKNTARMANLLSKQSSLYHRFLGERLQKMCDEDGLLLDKLSELDYFERSEMIRIWLDQQSFASPNESQMKELEKSFFQSRHDAKPTIKFYREDAQKTGVILSKINNYLIAEKINE